MRKDVTTREMLIDWFKKCPKDKRWLVVMCDTFSHEDYPDFCDAKEALRRRDTDGQNMQKVMECYDTKMDIKEQINQHRCFNWPTESDTPVEPKSKAKPKKVSSEETDTLVTYHVSATAGYMEHESAFHLLFEFSTNGTVKGAVTDFIRIIRGMVLASMNISELQDCCKKNCKKRGRNKPRFCPECGKPLTETGKAEPDDILEAYNDLFCRDFVLSQDLYDQFEAARITCWIDYENEHDQSVKLINISGLDYLVAGVKGRSTVHVANAVIGESTKVEI